MHDIVRNNFAFEPTSTDDTIILSGIDSDELSFKTYANVEDSNQELCQDIPQTPVPTDETCSVINEDNQSFRQDPPQTPVPPDETHAVINENNSPILIDERGLKQ